MYHISRYNAYICSILSDIGGALPPGTATRLTTGMAGNRPGTRGGQVGGGVGTYSIQHIHANCISDFLSVCCLDKIEFN